MKKHFIIGVVSLGIIKMASAAVFYQGTAVTGDTSVGSVVNGTILDGNTLGVANTMNLTGLGLGSSLVDIQVTLNISGGNNGDLYAYLSYNSVLVPLLNRIRVSSGNALGSSGTGMNVTLNDAAANNIHAAGGGVLSGNYRADGENISPTGPSVSFSATGGSLTLDGVGTGFIGVRIIRHYPRLWEFSPMTDKR